MGFKAEGQTDHEMDLQKSTPLLKKLTPRKT